MPGTLLGFLDTQLTYFSQQSCKIVLLISIFTVGETTSQLRIHLMISQLVSGTATYFQVSHSLIRDMSIQIVDLINTLGSQGFKIILNLNLVCSDLRTAKI